jgi:hypothetical protein
MSKPRWGTTRESVTEWVRPFSNWKLHPKKLAEGDGETICKTAGIEDMDDEVTTLDSAICDHQDNIDGGAGREERAASREDLDGAIEEFIDGLRKRLVPETVAAEEAELDRMLAEK